jgi:hypothetical protein
MIRQPSSFSRLYRWHRDAVANGVTDIHDGMPECGWFQRRLVKGGPLVPVEIRCERNIDDQTGELTGPERLIALVDGMRTEKVADIWSYLTPISRDAYDALVHRRASIPAMAATMAEIDLAQEPVRP